MTLGELREILATHYPDVSDDTEVLLSSDEEGNQIMKLNWVGTENYVQFPYERDVNLIHPLDVPDYEDNADLPLRVGLVLSP